MCLAISRVFNVRYPARVVSEHSSVSYFHKVLTPAITALLNSTSELTLFLPVNDAWEALPDIERLYLESEFATDDLNRILNAHAVVMKEVKWSDTFIPDTKRKHTFLSMIRE